MTRHKREDWLEQGLAVLVQAGVEALTIDGMCQRLGVTKGSFYHHFQNREAYLEALLQHWEDRYTSQFIAFSQTQERPAQQLRRLLTLVVETHGGEEASIRTWAKLSPMAQAYQERVDQRRLIFLQQILRDLGRDEVLSRVMANLFYVVLIGAQEIMPRLGRDELQAIYTLLERALRTFEEDDR
ncbi:MAG: TetR/AcrR family transcriptional regulator [Anaerolineae bacterium]|nr:TetR/AcrR family transcriptional regulator [Anaerolineae bacterium]CAG0982512.1 hypothetical protein ANRL4_01963 [Anaerolineae bacterium]